MAATSASLDSAIAELTGRQNRLISTAQLTGLGLDSKAIDSRVARRVLTRVVRGVYAAGPPLLTDEMLALAGVLYAGPTGVVRGETAAAMRGLLPGRSGVVEIDRAGRRRPVVLHTDLEMAAGGRGLVKIFRGTFRDDEIGTVGSCPVAEVPRILVDLAARDEQKFLEAWRGAEIARTLDLAAVRAQLDRTWRAGNPRVREHLASFRELDLGAGEIRSPLELEAIRLVLAAGAAMPLVNHRVDTLGGAKPFRLLDLYFELARLCIETDGWGVHGTRSQFEDDRVRDVELLELGILTMRYTRARLRAEPERCAQEILGQIALRTRDLAEISCG